MHYSIKMSPSSSAQRNQKHFFRFFLVVAGGRTGCGESCWWGVPGWGVGDCGEPSGGSPTFHVRTTCPSCRRKSCSTLETERDREVIQRSVRNADLDLKWQILRPRGGSRNKRWAHHTTFKVGGVTLMAVYLESKQRADAHLLRVHKAEGSCRFPCRFVQMWYDKLYNW